MTTKTKPLREYVAAAPGDLYWRREKCPHIGAKVLLLTKGNVCIVAAWRGEVGDFFNAWCPLPKDGAPAGTLPPPPPMPDDYWHSDSVSWLQRLRVAIRSFFQPRA